MTESADTLSFLRYFNVTNRFGVEVTLNKCGVDIVTKEIGTKQIPPIKELKMFLSKVRLGLQDPGFQRLTRNMLFLGAALALVVLVVFVVQTRTASSPELPGGATMVERHFPGKEKDDLGVGLPATEKYFPGKGKDDLGIGLVATERHFPGKEKDDLGVGLAPRERHFPGKAKDDLGIGLVPSH